MKNRTIVLSLLVLIVSLVNAQSWEWVGSRGFSSGGAVSVFDYDIAITGDSTIHVAYNSDGQNRTLVSQNVNGIWSSSVSYLTGGNGAYIDMKTGSNDTCYLGLSNANNGQNAMAYWSGDPNHDWSQHGGNNNGITPNPADYVNVDVDNNGINYLTCYRRTVGGRVQVYKWDNSTSSYAPLGGSQVTSEIKGTWPDIAISPNNIPFVAFQDVSANARKVSVYKWNEVTVQWDTITNRLSNGKAENIELEFYQDGSMYLAYTDDSEGGKAHVQKYNNGSWSDLGFASTSSGARLDMAISPSGIPVVTFLNATGDIKVYNGTNWQSVGIPSSDYALVNKIAFGSDGTLYAVGKDVSNGDKVSVRKFTGNIINVAASEVKENDVLQNLLVYPNPSNDVVNVVGDFKEIQILNSSGLVVLSTSKQKFSVNGLTPGIYYLRAIDFEGISYFSKVIKV